MNHYRGRENRISRIVTGVLILNASLLSILAQTITLIYAIRNSRDVIDWLENVVLSSGFL